MLRWNIRKFFKFQRVFLNRNNGSDVANRKFPKGKMPCKAVRLDSVSEDGFIKIVPLGKFDHWMGEQTITASNVKIMADNFEKRDMPLLLDYEHNAIFTGDTKAAGWAYELEAREDGLYMKKPEWTPNGQKQIDDKEYMFLSPVIDFKAKNPEGDSIGTRLHSVSVTNDPFFANLIDFIPNKDKEQEMKYSADYKKELGLPEDASDADVEAKVKKLNELVSEGTKLANPPEKKEESKEKSEENKEEEVKADETQVAVNSAVLKSLESITRRLDERDSTEKRVQAEALVNSAIADFKIAASDKEVWLNSAITNFDKTKTDLDARKRGTVMPAKLKTNSAVANSEEVTKENFRKVSTGQVFANAADYLRMQGR